MKTLHRTLHPEIRVLDAAKGLVEYIASDETVDSYREIIRAEGWRFTNFKKNAPFVDSHDTWSIDKQLGKVVDFRVDKKRLVETVQWAIDAGLPESHLANIGWKMTQAGYLKAVSVGFWPTKMVNRWDADRTGYDQQLAELQMTTLPDSQKPRSIYVEQEQVELSAVIIGANPNALAKARRDEVLSEAEMEAIRKVRSFTGALPVDVREIQEVRKVWFCPHCQQEIMEKHLGCSESDVMFHRDCGGGLILPPPSKEEQAYLEQFSRTNKRPSTPSASHDAPPEGQRARHRLRFLEKLNAATKAQK